MHKLHELTISVIIRFHNEIKYLNAVYKAIRSQKIEYDIEIISIDNNSTDGSLQVAKKYSDKVLSIDIYEPGKALNCAIAESSGSIIVILSAHTIPGNEDWLTNLLEPLIDKDKSNDIIATYGAQIYPYYSEFLDKRDLDIFNFAESRKETIDTDFWNANSAFERKVWEKHKFCERVYELEDHFWTKNILSMQKGYVYFNPKAYVYHYGHIKRIDRKYPNIKDDSESDLVKKASKMLSETNEWDAIMWAALICNSVSDKFITADIVELLGRHLIEHWDFDVRWRIAQTLGNIPGRSSISYLAKALYDKSFYPRNEAAWALKKHLPYSIQETEKVFLSSDGDTKLYAAFVLAHSNVDDLELKAIRYLEAQLLSTGESLLNSLYIIGEITQSKNIKLLIPPIIRLLNCNDISDKTLSIAIWCIGRLYEDHTFDFPFELLISKLSMQERNYIVCYESVNAICRYVLKSNDIDKAQKLYEFFDIQDGRVQYAICQAFRVISENKGVDLYRSTMDGVKDHGASFEIKSLIQNEEVLNGTYWN